MNIVLNVVWIVEHVKTVPTPPSVAIDVSAELARTTIDHHVPPSVS